MSENPYILVLYNKELFNYNPLDDTQRNIWRAASLKMHYADMVLKIVADGSELSATYPLAFTVLKNRNIDSMEVLQTKFPMIKSFVFVPGDGLLGSVAITDPNDAVYFKLATG